MLLDSVLILQRDKYAVSHFFVEYECYLIDLFLYRGMCDVERANALVGVRRAHFNGRP
jgi:hypothetical protein